VLVHCYYRWKDLMLNISLCFVRLIFINVYCIALMFLSIIRFALFLYNKCDDGILFKSVFYRKSDATHSVDSLSGLCSTVVCTFVILLLCVLLFRVSSVCLAACFGE